MNIKKMFIFPAISTFLLLVAMVFGLIATSTEEYLNYATDVAVSVACLIPFCLNVIAIVGSIKNSKSMVLIGTCIVLILAFIGDTVMAGCATVALGNVDNAGPLPSLTWVFFIMIWFTSILLMVSGFTSNAKKNGSAFMLASAILAAFFYIVFFFIIIIDFSVGANVNGWFVAFSVFFGLAILMIIGTDLAIAILGIKKSDVKADDEEELPGLTHTPKDLRLAKEDPVEEIKRWKQLLDCGALTQAEFEDKKNEILNRK